MLMCECGYNKRDHIARHLRTCRFHKLMEEQLAKNAQLEEQLAQQREQIAELNGRLDEARKPRTVKNNVKNVKNNNVIINIVPFGTEPIPDTKDILNLLNKPESSLSRYIEMKHFREPGMANVRLSSKRAKTMQVLEKDVNEQLRWTEKDKANMLEDIAEKNIEELVDKHKAERNERWKRWYRTMPEEGFDKTETWKRAVDSVENMLISQSRCKR